MRKSLFVTMLLCVKVSYAAEFQTLPNANTVKLTPQMRAEPETKALYSVKTTDILSFLENVSFFDHKTEFDHLPYILGFDNGSTMGATGDKIFVMGIKDNDISAYTMVNFSRKLKDPNTDKEIGIQAYAVGSAEVILPGEPATLVITNALYSADVGTKLIPRIGLDLPAVIDATIPNNKNLKGYLVAVQNENVGVGNGSVIIINLGKKDGVEIGNLFDLVEPKTYVTDPVTSKKVELPYEEFGEILIYQVRENVSLALITKATRAALVGDIIISKTPD